MAILTPLMHHMRIQNGATFTINAIRPKTKFIINAIRPKKCHPPWKKSYEKSKAQAPVPPSLHQRHWRPKTPGIQCSGKSTNWMVPAFTSLGTTSSNGATFTRHGRNYMRNQRLNNNETKLKIESRTSPSINGKNSSPVQSTTITLAFSVSF